MSDSIKERFLKDVSEHQMTVDIDHQGFRCIRFQKPGSIHLAFTLTTWHDCLCINGDMGDYVFQRTNDMFTFFRQEELSINVGYWTEKLKSISKFGTQDGRVYEYDHKATCEHVLRHLKENDYEADFIEQTKGLLESCPDYDEEVIRQLDDHGVIDAHEFIATKPTFHIQWCLYAIVWGIQQYDQRQPGV